MELSAVNEKLEFSEKLVEQVVSGTLEIEEKKLHLLQPSEVHEDILKLVRDLLK